jgi:hypothetical protein
MKRRIGITLAIVLLAAVAGGWWSATHHVVMTRKGVVVVGKRFLGFKDTFVNINTWKAREFRAHPELRTALLRAGYGDLIAERRLAEWADRLEEFKTLAEVAITEMKDAAMSRTADWVDETYRYWVAEN